MADFHTNLSKRIDDVEAALGARFTTLENAHKLFEDWRPEVDATIDNFRVELGAMRKTMNRVVPDSKAASSADLPTKMKMTATSTSTGNPVIEPDRHHMNTHHQGPVFQTHLTDKGMCGFPKPKLIQSKSHSLLEGLGHQASLAGLLTKPEMATTSASVGNPVIGPVGHHVDTHRRGSKFQTHLPDKGTCGFHDPSSFGSHPIRCWRVWVIMLHQQASSPSRRWLWCQHLRVTRSLVPMGTASTHITRGLGFKLISQTRVRVVSLNPKSFGQHPISCWRV